MKQANPKVVIAFKVDRKLALQLERIAKSNERSMGAEIRVMLARYVNENGKASAAR